MARFDSYGLESLLVSIEELADIPGDVADEMLLAAGEVIQKYHKEEISSLGLVETGKLRDSVRVFLKRSGFGRYVLVYPYGKHSEYNRRLKVKAYKRSKHGRTYTVGGDVQEVTNNDVGFLMEFGAPGKNIDPKQWMRLANEKGIDEAIDAESAVYSRWLNSKGL